MSNHQKKIIFNDSFLNENECIFNKYKPIKKIGKGSFGNIYSIIRLKDKSVFAMKTEKIKSIEKTLESEAYFLYMLQGFGIPKLISYGHTKKHNILIETLLDKSLHNIFLKNEKICNIIDACLIGIQILDRLEWIHSKYILYRDVKPENFMIGLDDPNVIYVVDFGLCKKYRSSKTGKHILPKMNRKFIGTLKYASFNVVKGKESSRRDDLISLGYMLIYLLKKQLPWESNFQKLNKQKYYEVLYLKNTDGCGELFKKVPEEFVEYIKYSKKLKFEQEPNYSYLRSLFIKIIFKMKLNYKILSFSWINSTNNKLLSFPRNSSSRKSSPHIRIYNNIKEYRIRKLKSETINDSKVHYIPKFLKKISISKYKNINNLSLNKSHSNRIISLNNSSSSKFDIINKEKIKEQNLYKKCKSIKTFKNIILKKNNDISTKENKNDLNNKRDINSSLLLYNKYINNFEKNNIYRKLIIKRTNTLIENNKNNNKNDLYNSSNISNNKKRVKFIKQKKENLYINIIPFHLKIEEINLSNNIVYKSPIFKFNISKNNLCNSKCQNSNFEKTENIYI